MSWLWSYHASLQVKRYLLCSRYFSVTEFRHTVFHLLLYVVVKDTISDAAYVLPQDLKTWNTLTLENRKGHNWKLPRLQESVKLTKSKLIWKYNNEKFTAEKLGAITLAR